MIYIGDIPCEEFKVLDEGRFKRGRPRIGFLFTDSPFAGYKILSAAYQFVSGEWAIVNRIYAIATDGSLTFNLPSPEK